MQKLALSVMRHAIVPVLLVMWSVYPLISQAAETSQALDFVTHAAFFSKESKQKKELDPQVFVKEPMAPAAVGPQGIKHVAGIRNAWTSDETSLPIFNAQGHSLDMSLGQWLAAKGQVILTPLANGRERIEVAMSGLKPTGHYSLFENHFDQQPVGFTPLDGNGAGNNFVADAAGKGVASIIVPSVLTHDNAVLLVYHSDNKTHGTSRGDIGVNAHHQLIARPQ